MIVKGTTGEANGFTLAADAGADPGLTAFAYGSGGGMTLGQAAADAKFTIDGVAFSRATNIVRSEEHTSELQSLMRISYDVLCLKKKKNIQHNNCRTSKTRTNNIIEKNIT